MPPMKPTEYPKRAPVSEATAAAKYRLRLEPVAMVRFEGKAGRRLKP